MLDAYYFDSSGLLKRYLTEPGTPRVFDLTRTTAGHLLFISRLTVVEIVATLARHGKQGGTLAPDAAQQALREFRFDVAQQYYVLEIAPALMEYAEALAETYALRGADAVQLAVARAARDQAAQVGVNRFTFVSSDREQLEAARQEGMAVEDPSFSP